jgi:hypothetical protein
LRGNTKEVRSGAVMTEMVIVMPAILLLMAAIIQFSMLFSDSLQLNYASYRRTRGAVIGDNDEVQFSDKGLEKIWERIMPGAKSVPELDSAVNFSGNDSEYIDTRLVTSTLIYDSQLLIPMIFGPNTLKTLGSDNQGQYYIQLRAKGFSPAVVLSPKEGDDSVWWKPWTWW